jgi:carbamoyl-phosphate synthase large subunit
VGGQTALNLAVALAEDGTLERYGVELIGAKIPAIKTAEDRNLFAAAMRRIGQEMAEGFYARTPEEALTGMRQRTDGFPLIIRPSFTLGGTGGSIAYHPEELEAAVKWGLQQSPMQQVLIEEVGDRLEGVRARGDARPRRQRGHHLLDRELRPDGRAHRRLHHGGSRADADRQGIPAHARRLLAIIREIGVETGGSNIQFAVNPRTAAWS